MEGACRPLCSSDSDCVAGNQVCRDRFCVAGCGSDADCAGNAACIQGQCQNPCLFSQCGTCAECSVIGHQALCSCPREMTGNPNVGCVNQVFYLFFFVAQLLLYQVYVRKSLCHISKIKRSTYYITHLYTVLKFIMANSMFN